jgi:hypothetical protein
MRCVCRCLIKKKKPISAGTVSFRDVCSIWLSTGLAVLENNSRELAFLANQGKLSTIYIEGEDLGTVGHLPMQETLQGAGSSGISTQGASNSKPVEVEGLQLAAPAVRAAPISKTHVIWGCWVEAQENCGR